jgi:hypothetical protein
MRKLVVSLVVALTSLALAQSEDEVRTWGRELTKAFYAGEMRSILEASVTGAPEYFGGEEGLLEFLAEVLAVAGDERRVLAENVDESEGVYYYRRVARHEAYGGPLEVIWGFVGREVFHFTVLTLAPTEAVRSGYLDRETEADLRLPFDGEWTVTWGGRSFEDNYHTASLRTRFALDVTVMRGGAAHSGAGRANGDYYCFGQPVLAPGGGVVVASVDGLPDAVPERSDPAWAVDPGNHVVIDHGTGEYSLLGHLRRGSVVVEPGQRVSAGDVVGACGNSGTSGEPHLLYQLMTDPDLWIGEGLPAQFQRYLADGVLVERGEPVKGQVVAHVGGD